jgi:hypothetical protein
MQNGVFILNANAAYSNTNCIPLGVKNNLEVNTTNFIFYPNPASAKIAVNYSTGGKINLQITTIFGQLVFQKNYINSINDYIQTENLENGTYLISVTQNNKTLTQKLIINH